MAGLNKVQIIGNLGQDPEMRFTANGRAVSTFSVAVNRSYTTSEGERREETEWVRVVAWARLAELVSQYLTKGRLVYVEGRMQTRQWDDKEGQRRYTTEVVAQDIQFLDRGDSPGPDQQSSQSAPSATAGGAPSGGAAPTDGVDPNDLPFE
jgi:single-strand DNA-binding protein